MNKYLQALNEISAAVSYSNYGDENLNAIDLYTLRNLVDKHEKLKEYLVEQKQSHTMSRFVRVSDLESFRYAIDLVLKYLEDSNNE